MTRAYDLVFSLGANCSAAHNLKIRQLRPFALPLDWTYMVDEKPLVWLRSAFASGFSGFCEWENLEEILPGHPEYTDFHKGRRKFIDKLTGYRFINHFMVSGTAEEDYRAGYCAIKRRIERLFDALSTHQRFLLVLGSRHPVHCETLIGLRSSLSELFPGKLFDIDTVEFNAAEDIEDVPADGMRVRRFRRDWNAYDTEGKNWEWHFLDDVCSTLKPKKRPKLSFHVWPHVKCIMQFHKT